MVTRQDLATYREAQALIARNVEAELRALWRMVEDLPLDEIAGILVNEIPLIIDKYGAMGQIVAAEWFEQLIHETAFVPDLYQPDVWQASTRASISPLFDPHKTSAAAFSYLVKTTNRHVANHGRETIAENAAEKENVFFARSTTSREPCNFCLVLASRGPVYGPKTATETRDGRRYHDTCSCVAVPMRGVWIPDPSNPRGVRWEGDTIAGLNFEKIYAENYAPFHRDGDTITDVVARMRAANPGSP